MADKKLTLKDLSLGNKRVLMRVDFNVPIENGQIEDDSRIHAAIPSIEYVLKHGGSLILMSHLGRPKGKPDPSMSLKPVAKRLSEILKKPIQMANDSIGPDVEKMAKGLMPGHIMMLENLRFHVGEENPAKDPDFTKELSKLGNVYVNDAFGTAHREHASTALIAKYFPKQSAMGFLMEKELKALGPLLDNPERPFYALIGGAKVSSKIGILKKLLTHVDAIFIGGGMAFTFLKEKGIPVGESICEDPNLIKDFPKDKLHLPIDLVIADKFENSAKTQTISVDQGIPDGWHGMDIGPKTIAEWDQKLKNAKTVFWNGPVGVYEMSNFEKGTHAIADFLAKSNAKTFVGGGNSVSAIQQIGLADQFTHLSTGGGASLEFLELGHLPGIDALTSIS